MMRRLLLALVGCLVLAGCDQRTLVDRLAPADDASFAKARIEELRAGRIDALRGYLDPTLATPDTLVRLKQVTAYFPPGEPRTVKTVGFAKHTFNGHTSVTLTFEYGFDRAWALADLTATRQDGQRTILGLHVYRMSQSLEQTNAFSLAGRPPASYLVLALACAVPVFCLVALVVCVRTRFKGRKWPWILFILFGVGTLHLNWTTGAMGVQPLSVLLFGASAMSSPYGPWMISVGLPLGAIWFLLRRRRLAVAAAPMPPATATAEQ